MTYHVWFSFVYLKFLKQVFKHLNNFRNSVFFLLYFAFVSKPILSPVDSPAYVYLFSPQL